MLRSQSKCVLLLLSITLLHIAHVAGKRVCVRLDDAEIARLVSQSLTQEAPNITSSDGAVEPQGSRENVDYRRLKAIVRKAVNAVVAEKINSMVSLLQTSVQSLQSENGGMNESMQTPENNVPKCKDGDIYYGGYCFWFDATERHIWASRSKCESRNSTLGIILDSNHYDIMMNNLVKAIPSRNSNWKFWLGLQQDESTGAVTIASNGLKAPFLKWKSGEPDRYSFETRILLQVWKDKDPSYFLNGMADWVPTFDRGVICQYKSL